MIKPTRLIYTLLLIMGIVGISFLVYSFVLENKRDANNTDLQGEKGKIEQSKYPGVDIITFTSDQDLYQMAVHYPKFKDKFLNDEMNKYLSNRQQNFYDELDQLDEELLKERPANFYLTFEIHPVRDQLYSIVFSEEGYFGGANSRQNIKVFHVDLSENRFINQTDFINDTKENREKLYDLLLHEFQESEEYSPYFFEEELKKWIENENNDFANIYLTSESMVFKFNKYELTAGVVGMPEITLPLDQVKDLLASDWLKRLDPKRNNHKNESIQSPKDLEVEDNEGDHESSQKEPTNNPEIKEKRVALTFDDGPHPTNTLKIVELLEKHDAKATFFMLGSRVDFYPEIAQRVAVTGNEVGNHTWNHKDLTSLSSQQVIEEVQTTNEIIQEAIGNKPTVFRPPYGASNNEVKASIEMPTVLWTIDTLDWKTHDPNAVLENVKENIEDGSIILMHDIHETTVEAVELLLIYLEEEGYQCVNVSELL